MNWARQAFLEGYNFVPIQKTYRTQIDKLEKWMGMQDHRPEEKSIEVPGIKNTVDTLKVTRFDFITQFKSLLDDPVLNRDENLVINPTDRFQKYSPPDGRLGECLSGSWYNHAWDEMVKDGICDFMIPIILYIDKTQISISGKLSICPVQMSLGIFTEKASNSMNFLHFLIHNLLVSCCMLSVVGLLMPGGLWVMCVMKMFFFLALNGPSTLQLERVCDSTKYWIVF
jgi:hypothetical protein